MATSKQDDTTIMLKHIEAARLHMLRVETITLYNMSKYSDLMKLLIDTADINMIVVRCTMLNEIQSQHKGLQILGNLNRQLQGYTDDLETLDMIPCKIVTPIPEDYKQVYDLGMQIATIINNKNT